MTDSETKMSMYTSVLFVHNQHDELNRQRTKMKTDSAAYQHNEDRPPHFFTITKSASAALRFFCTGTKTTLYKTIKSNTLSW